MKNILLIVMVFVGIGLSQAQRLGFVDTEYILNNLPEYQRSKERLDEKIKEWSDEIKHKKDSVTLMKTALETEKIILTEEQYKQKLEEIQTYDEEVEALKEQRYGPEGDLVKLRLNLIKPIQNKVYNAVKLAAEKRNLQFVLDKSSGLVMIYSDPKSSFDLSDEVLNRLKQ